jgi:choline-sulfatase
LDQQRREYDEYIAYADAEFGRLYDLMAQGGILDNTYVVVTSDHGEIFERGIRGHVTPVLYEPVIRVPLLISRPGQQQREDVYTPTSSVDLVPTLLHTFGQRVPDWCEGQVLPKFGGTESGDGRSVFVVEAKSNPKSAPLRIGTVAVIRDRHKLVQYSGYKGYEDTCELYDLANDPEEMEDLYASERRVAADLQDELRERLQEVNQPYLGTT